MSVGGARCGALGPVSVASHGKVVEIVSDKIDQNTEVSHVRDSFGTVEVTEFGSDYLAGVRSGRFQRQGVSAEPLWNARSGLRVDLYRHISS